MPQQSFSITIARQGWLPGCDAAYDLCSHGRIRVVIGNELVSANEMDYGISESALALLRTLENDHTRECPVAERLVFHGCGAILMMGCPIGIDWEVRHIERGVSLSNVRRFDSTATETSPVLFPAATGVVSAGEYRQAIIAFATAAKGLFLNVPKTIDDSFDKHQYAEFWDEYERLLLQFQ